MKLGAALLHTVMLFVFLSCQPVENDITRHARVLQPGKAEEVGMSSAALGAAVDIMRRAIAADKTTGVQLLVARHGRIVMHEALGLRDLERQLPMEQNTLLRMASVTKTVVATGILMLADEGRLNLSDPVSKFLPGFSAGLSSQLTVEHLISHSTGFPYTFKNYVGEVTMKSPEHPDAPSLGVEASKIGEVGPEVVPGTTCRYSNRGFIVLGGVLEAASGEKLDAFLRKRLYQPLGMNETSHELYGVDPERISLNYQRNGDAWDVLPPRNPPFARSTGGLVTTALDYAKFAQLYLDQGRFEGGGLLTPKTVRQATRVHSECEYIFVTPNRLQELELAPMWYYRRDSRELGIDVGFGHGWAIARNGALSHGGYRGTFVLIDPQADMIILIFAQSRVGGTPGQEFIDAVYGAIVE